MGSRRKPRLHWQTKHATHQTAGQIMSQVIIGKAALHHGDCMEFMRDIPDNYYCLAVCDPPYGIKIAEWDNEVPDQAYFDELFRVSKNQIIWGGNYFNLPHSEGWICWDKTYKYNRKLDIAEFEMAWTSFDKKSKFCRFTYCGNFYGWDAPRADYKKPVNVHPTQKPHQIYEWLLTNYAKAGDKILDTHGGSFSSAIACNNLGFDFTGIELDKDYYDAAVLRVTAASKQIRMFA